MNREERRARLRRRFRQADESFMGLYKDQLNELLGLPREKIDELTPDSTDLLVYDKLIATVKEASAQNVKQGELIENIKELGELGIKIAKKVPKLATLLL